jgi:two-component system, NarL family, sensor histidine kinase UhpB
MHAQTLIQALGQIVYDWHPGTRELRWDGDFTRLLGYDAGEMGNSTESWTERVHPDDLARVLREVEDCTRERRYYDLEYRFRRRDGSYVWMHDRGVPFFDANGALERVVGVFSDISERKRAQEALQRSAARLHALARRVVESEESERRKINRELHDRVGQGLSSLVLALELVRQTLPPEAIAAVGARLDDARALALRAVEDTRDVMADLRPPALDEFGLAPALRSLAETFGSRNRIQISVRGGAPLPELSSIVQTALYRIAQEALVNVAKHAGATRIAINLVAQPGGVELSIADDGRGFEPAHAESGPKWGLRTMRERAEAVGGVLQIDSRSGQGTTISVRVTV